MNVEKLASFEPRSLDDAAALMRDAARANLRLAFVGGGTHSGPHTPDVDALFFTRGLSQIREYAPEDQTVTVEAGISVATLLRTLSDHGQRLVLDVAEPERSTVGGAVAANVWGPRRQSYGSLKDLLLGVSLVRADGTVAHAGGKVVKNVAGFDLSKLMVGSHGTLALVTALTLRVHPIPELVRAFRIPGIAPEKVLELVMTMRARQLEPGALIVTRGAHTSGYALDVLLEGFAAGVVAKAGRLTELVRAAGASVDEVTAAEVDALDAHARSAGPLRIRAVAPAADFVALDAAAGGLSPLLDSPQILAYPGLGVAFVSGTPNASDAVSAALAAARAELERRGGSLTIEALPSTGFDAVDRWGTPPPSLALMHNLKALFDPSGRLNPHSFIGGI